MLSLAGRLGAALALLATPALAQPLLTPQEAASLIEGGAVALDIRSAEDGAPHPFEAGRVPGSVRADYRETPWRVTRDGVVGMLPETEAIAGTIRALGVDAGEPVVIVNAGVGANGVDMGAATRVYWTFKVLGHDAVSILEGGFRAWEAAGLPVETGPSAAPEAGTFAASFRPELYATTEEVAAAIGTPGALLDGRPAAQFSGAAQSGAVARAGALPGATNYPVQSMLTDEGGRFVPAEEIARTLAGIEAEQGGATEIAYCNTGHWASLAWFAASEIAGREGVAVYDGSMAEWAADPERPVTPGGAPAL